MAPRGLEEGAAGARAAGGGRALRVRGNGQGRPRVLRRAIRPRRCAAAGRGRRSDALSYAVAPNLTRGAARLGHPSAAQAPARRPSSRRRRRAPTTLCSSRSARAAATTSTVRAEGRADDRLTHPRALTAARGSGARSPSALHRTILSLDSVVVTASSPPPPPAAGEEMRAKLSAAADLEAFILMERIRPVTTRALFLRKGVRGRSHCCPCAAPTGGPPSLKNSAEHPLPRRTARPRRCHDSPFTRHGAAHGATPAGGEGGVGAERAWGVFDLPAERQEGPHQRARGAPAQDQDRGLKRGACGGWRGRGMRGA